MSGYNNHPGTPYNFSSHAQHFSYSSPQLGMAHFGGQHQTGNHQATLQAGTAYPHSVLPSAAYHIPVGAPMPVLPPNFVTQPAIHAPSSSPGPISGDRASTPDLPVLPQQNSLRTSPRSNKGVAPPRAPQTVAQQSGGKSIPKDASKSGSSAPQNPSQKASKSSAAAKVEDDDMKNKAWTDEEVTMTFAYLFGDLEDGDIGEGKYRDWQSNKSHWNRKMSTELFGGKRAPESIKSKLDRSLKIYKYIVVFEDHTGGGGDGDDDGLSESEKIKIKLDSVRKAGKDVGNITVAEISKWKTLGWYEMIDRCLGTSHNVRRKTTISSVNAPSPFSGNDAGDAEPATEDPEYIPSDNEEERANVGKDTATEEANNDGTSGGGEGEEREGNEAVETSTHAAAKTDDKKGEKKRAGPTSTRGVEEPPHKKKKPAAASVDTTEFLAANAEYFRAQVKINERSQQLKEKQYQTTTALAKNKFRAELAQNILASDNMDDEVELKEAARDTIRKALQGE